MISGSRLPVGARVLVAGVVAPVVHAAAPTRLIVRIPAGSAGRADVTVYSPTNVFDILEDAYTYVAPGAPAPAGPTPPPSSPPPPGSTPGPGGTTPTPAPGGTPGSPATGPFPGPDGLTLARPAAGSVLASFPATLWTTIGCRTATCAGVVV